MKLLAIDPGTEQSAWLLYDTETGKPFAWSIHDNNMVLDMVRESGADVLLVEMVASYGMPVGREVFETCVWIGRFIEAYPSVCTHLIYRRDIKLHLCQSARAKDSNVWQALVDRYGGKAAAVGVKAAPGPLYGLKSHCRAALAVAVTWADTRAGLNGSQQERSQQC